MLSGRAKRVLVYTVALLTAPMPVMPFEPRTRQFYVALVATATILGLASFYVMRGELRAKNRPLVGTKMLASSIITLLFAIFMLACSIIYFVQPKA